MFSRVTIYNFAVSQTAAFASHSFFFFIKQHFFGATLQQPPTPVIDIFSTRLAGFPSSSDWYPIENPSIFANMFLTLWLERKSRSLERYAVSEKPLGTTELSPSNRQKGLASAARGDIIPNHHPLIPSVWCSTCAWPCFIKRGVCFWGPRGSVFFCFVFFPFLLLVWIV